MKLLTLARDLQRRKSRQGRGLFTIEGTRAAEEALASPLTLHGALVSERLGRTPRGVALRSSLETAGVEIGEISDAELGSASDTEQSQGVLLVAEVPIWSDEALISAPTARWLVVDAVQDPGNLGTILRTAAALSTDAVFLLPGTVDAWNAKVVRSAMGALFRLPTFSPSVDALDGMLRRSATPLWVADAAGTSVGEVEAPRRLALAVGNEGAGVSAAVHAIAERSVALPIASDVESLNVAVATGILLYVLRP